MKLINIIKLIVMSVLMITLSFSSVSGATNDLVDIQVSLVNQDPSPVVAGDIVELRVGVENIGYSSASNVIIEIDDEYPFTVISDSTQKIGVVQAANNDGSNLQIVKFRVRVDSDISAGSYDIVLKEYSENSPSTVTEHTISVDVKTKESVEIVSIDKSFLTPGQKETVTFKLKNVGSSDLKDIIFSWEDEDDVILAIGADNSVYIKEIAVGESIDVPFDMIASSGAEADLYKLTLKVNYEDSLSSSAVTSTTTAGMYVGGNTDFDLVFSEVSGGEYAFTVSNIGANDAESVTIKVPSQDSWKLGSSNSEIIGNLNKGDYTTISFDLTSIGGSSAVFNIDYTNTMGQRVTVEKQVEISSDVNTNSTSVKTGVPGSGTGRMGSMSSGITNVVTYAKYTGYFILILIVGIVAYKVMRKKKKN